MERVRRLRGLWNWLPAFRAAAETEHLPTAAQKLHVSTSAISRTVRLLEEELGHALFERRGRAIELNRAGQQFLTSVRDAMRILDEGVETVAELSLAGPVDIAAPRHLISVLVMPAIDRLTPGLVARVHAVTGNESARLRRGELDVAVVEHITPHDDMSLEQVTELSHGIYCAEQHPLASRRRVVLRDLEESEFVAAPGDRWPIERERHVAVHATDPDMAARMCAHGRLLAILPDMVAHATPSLHRLPIDITRPTPLYIAYRRPVAQHVRTESLLEALRARLLDL